jgi:phosphoglycerate dehydrogenase-like enzyme
MSDPSLSRRFFLSAAAAVPAVPTLIASDRIAIFEPPPDRVHIVTISQSYAAPAVQYTPEEIKQITSQGKNVQMTLTTSAEELTRMLPDADVVFGAITPPMLKIAKNLRWMQHTEAGMENGILYPELIDSPIVVTNMARMFAPAISETAVAMLLALTRGLNKYFIPQFEKKQFNPVRNGLVEIEGGTVGLVGFGGLGEETAKRFHHGFNMRVMATDAKPLTKPEWVDELHEPSWYREMAPKVDILVNAAPAIPETVKMFDEKVFRSMKKSAYFISISRGPNVDQVALARALREGWIAGACLDVTVPEPLPPTSELWDCPNLVMTCHTAGFAPQRRIRQMGLMAENVRRYTSGLPLFNVVDKKRGY